jgi:putative methionine-R-sulfoxide reductase with GAF domain
MVGFGIMDNFVMITAGDAIDSTFGVAFGLSTMAAAGFGQCVSDVAGVTSGGVVDNAVSKLNLPKHGLSQAQLELKQTRMYSTFGACVGVFSGCLLGMSVLLIMDTDRADREKRAKELQSIFESVMDQGHDLLGCQRAALFMVDDAKKEVWSRVATGTGGKIIKTSMDAGLVGACVTTGKTVNVANAYDDPRFNQNIDKSTGYTTRSVLCMPIKDNNGKIIGAIEMMNKKAEDGSDTVFDETDERMLTMLASHVSSFIRIVETDDG